MVTIPPFTSIINHLVFLSYFSNDAAQSNIHSFNSNILLEAAFKNKDYIIRRNQSGLLERSWWVALTWRDTQFILWNNYHRFKLKRPGTHIIKHRCATNNKEFKSKSPGKNWFVKTIFCDISISETTLKSDSSCRLYWIEMPKRGIINSHNNCRATG